MSDESEKSNQPNFRPEKWRREQFEKFDTIFRQRIQEIGQHLGSQRDQLIKTEEHYSPEVEGGYFLSGHSEISDKMPAFSLSWDPAKKIVDQHMIMLEDATGLHVLGSVESLASELGANIYVISAITNIRLEKILIRKGYKPYPAKPHAVYKDL